MDVKVYAVRDGTVYHHHRIHLKPQPAKPVRVSWKRGD